MAWSKQTSGSTGLSQYGIKRANTANASGTAASYMDALAAAVEAMKPGGSTYQAMASELDRDAKLYGNKLQAGAISSGLGNAALGDSTKVFKTLTAAKTQLQSNMMSQYIASLQNLASLAFQREESVANRELQSKSTMASQGYSAAGTKLTDFGFGSNPTASSFGNTKKSVTASSLPSLYSAGGYGGSNVASDDTIAALTGPLFGGNVETNNNGITWDYSLMAGKSVKTPSGGTMVF